MLGMPNDMKRVLVSGGAGFIGSHLVEALLSRGYSVNVLDDLSSGHAEWVHRAASVHFGSILNTDDCRSAMLGCAGVFHLAAQSRSLPSVDDPMTSTRVNVLGTQTVLNAAVSAGVKKLVYAGSSTYYGNQKSPHVETMRGSFLNTYGLSKYVGEELCLLYSRLYGLPCNVMRFFNVYGPRQPETGEYALVLGKFLERAKANLPLEIHGTGAQRRDFIHVEDVCRALIIAYETPLSGRIWNVGSGVSTSIQELADMISPLQVYGPARIADADETLADIRSIQKDIGWHPLRELTSQYGRLPNQNTHSF